MSELITGEHDSCEVINPQSFPNGTLNRCIRQPQRGWRRSLAIMIIMKASPYDKDWPSLRIVSVAPGRLYSSTVLRYLCALSGAIDLEGVYTILMRKNTAFWKTEQPHALLIMY